MRGWAAAASLHARLREPAPGVHRGPLLLAQCGVDAPARSPVPRQTPRPVLSQETPSVSGAVPGMGTKTPDAPHCKPVSPSTPWCWDVDLGRQSHHRGQTTVARRRGVTPGVRNGAHHCAPWKCRSGAAGFCPPRVASRGMPLPFRASGVIKLVTPSHVLEVLPRYQSLSSRDTACSLLPSGSATSSPFVHLHPSSSHLRKVRVVTARPVGPAPAPADGVRLRRSRARGPSVPGTRLHGPPRPCRTG